MRKLSNHDIKDLFFAIGSFCIFLVFCVISYDTNQKYFQVQEELSRSNRSIEALKEEVKFLNVVYYEEKQQNEIALVKIDILEEAVDPKNSHWAKIKKVRDAIRQSSKDHGTNWYFKNTEELTDFASSIVQYSEEFDVPLTLSLAVAHQESHFNPRAVSRAGALGIMQVMPTTAEDIALDLGYRHFNARRDLKRVKHSTKFGIYYLSKMLDTFSRDFHLSIMAYNTGPTNVQKVVAGELSDYYQETKCYVRAILGDNTEERPLVESCPGYAKNTAGYMVYYEKLGL